MWILHINLFNAPGLAAWIGLSVVVLYVVSSLFNSHLFDFTQGLGYALAVGVAGAVVLRENVPGGSAEAHTARTASPRNNTSNDGPL